MKTLLSVLLFSGVALAQQPNVLFIAVDDLRPDLGCYGASHMVTPNIDTLASQGRVFSHHYVAVPTCGASRYALMSGLRPTSSTDDNNAFNNMPTSLPANPESWVDLLRRNGWHTASMGKLTHEPDGFRWDFPSNYDIGRSRATLPDMRFSWDEIIYDHDKWGAQRYPLFAYADGTGRVRNVSAAYEVGVDGSGASLPDEAYPDGQMAQAAIGKLREFADDGTRFCLAVGFYKPHLPFNAPKAYWDLYDPLTLPGPVPVSVPTGANSSTTTNSGEINAYTGAGDRDLLRHAYFACVSYVDAQVGKVLAELDSLGLADNTIVVLWGDHGWCLDDYGLIGKHKVLERSLESPLIIRAPEASNPAAFAGIPAEGVVESIDIYPTIAELCGLTPPAGPDGSSLVPMLRNPFAPGKSHAYSRWGGLTTIRTLDWRLIQASGDYDLYDLSSFRYELEDVSGSNPSVVTALSADLGTQGNRSGTTYATWAGGSPLLLDPDGDGDGDGASNRSEYGAGTDGLDPTSRPTQQVSFEDLTAEGFSADETVFRFQAASDRDDLSLVPSTSTDLLNWSFPPLEFLDATDLGGDVWELRFRLTDLSAAARFFQLEDAGAP
ncbi:iduronate-2-sulfatase [Haloferula helveola]|uniref:Iduronate-2-sulfatase n=1 Tax=Haloferula helveola TaxID=490095 RepID=A0ABN6H9K2_9BACT|nr:iduronate-2-sulfatase [Haloferula helveola]